MLFAEVLNNLAKFNSICADSRKVKHGDLFVCIPCVRQIANITQAISNGAKLIVCQAETMYSFTDQVECVVHDNPRLALSLLAKAYFKAQPSTLVAVTGTNGKSSVVSLVRQFWELLGYKSASFGTLGLEAESEVLKTMPPVPELTTYDSLSFFKILKDLTNAKVDCVAFEASSHGLEQYRVHVCNLSVAAFTNLTQDHLDYHENMENYFQAKAKLFTEILPTDKVAVINADTPYFQRLKDMITNPIISYGINSQADINALKIKTHGSSITFDLCYKGLMYHQLTLNLAGIFQVENVLCAIAILIGLGHELQHLLSLIPLLKSVKGRMEFIGSTPSGADVYVDYAHTPDALERSLKSLREHTNNNVWLVFGCGGDRDNTKRPIMGKIASSFSDNVIITDDNPRSEDPSEIRQQIIDKSMDNVLEISGRAQAITYAVKQLKKGDTLLIAGKGHETGQIIGNTTYPFSDKNQVEIAIAGLK